MIVDTSAILSIVLVEGDRLLFQEALARSEAPLTMSCVNSLEAAIRCDTLGKPFSDLLESSIATNGIVIAGVTADDANLAREAYKRFGKGNHPAKLNLGDCFAYALAKARGEPLLFKGDDFRRTDIEAAL